MRNLRKDTANILWGGGGVHKGFLRYTLKSHKPLFCDFFSLSEEAPLDFFPQGSMLAVSFLKFLSKPCAFSQKNFGYLALFTLNCPSKKLTHWSTFALAASSCAVQTVVCHLRLLSSVDVACFLPSGSVIIHQDAVVFQVPSVILMD